MRLLFILAILFAIGLSFSSLVNFTTPTNGTIFSNATFYLFNATATQSSAATPLSVLNWTWNGTSYVFYNATLLAMYDFDNVSSLGENDSFVVDHSLNSNNLSCVNCSIWTSSGRYGGAFTFDGVDDYFNGSQSSSLEVQALSIESWIYIDSSPGTRSAIVTYGYGTTAGGPVDGSAESYSLSYQNDVSSFRFRLKDAIGNNIIDLYTSSSTPLSQIQNQWVHVAATWDGTNARIYKNGQSILSTSNAGTINYYNDPGVKLRIGNWFGNDERWFKGKIDSVKIYGRAFNSSEILQHYYSDLSKHNSTAWFFYSNQSISDEGQNTYNMCMLDSSNDLNCTLSKNLTIDRTGPSISLVSPANRSELSSSSSSDVSFFFNATDSLSSNLSCTFVFDGSDSDSNASVSNSSITEFTHSVGSSSTWAVSCSDLAGNSGTSSAYSIGTFSSSASSSSSSTSRIRSSFQNSCNQNTFTTTPPYVDVVVFDDDSGEIISRGESDSSGIFTFRGCGKTIRYSLSKSGYKTYSGVETLDSCSCLEESSSPVFETQADPTPISTESEQSSGSGDLSNSSIRPLLVTPLDAHVGDNIEISSYSCLGCTLMVEDPSGIVLRVDLGDSRSTNLTITKPGNYQFSLIRDGETVSHTSLISSSIPSLAPSTPQPQSDVIPTPIKTSTSGNLSWIIIPILLLIIIFVGFFFFRSKKRK